MPFLVYDVTNRTSFDRLEHWLAEIDTYCTKSDAIKMLIGNKIDMVGFVKFSRKINLAKPCGHKRRRPSLCPKTSNAIY